MRDKSSYISGIPRNYLRSCDA